MNKETEKYLLEIVEEKSLTVMDGCLRSLKVSLELADLPIIEKERMLSLIELMSHHYEMIGDYVQAEIDKE